MKPQPEFAGVRSYERGKWARVISAGGRDEHDFFVPNPVASMGDYLPNTKNGPWISPYGDDPHDLLWVRETWGCPASDHPRCKDGRKPSPGDKIVYDANPADSWQWQRGGASRGSFVWRSPIHMPRWASRITLRVTDVRIELLQKISEVDAKAEGVKPTVFTESDVAAAVSDSQEDQLLRALGPGQTSHKFEFQCRWDAINAKRGFGWDVNPWVWVVSFEVLPDAS